MSFYCCNSSVPLESEIGMRQAPKILSQVLSRCGRNNCGFWRLINVATLPLSVCLTIWRASSLQPEPVQQCGDDRNVQPSWLSGLMNSPWFLLLFIDKWWLWVCFVGPRKRDEMRWPPKGRRPRSRRREMSCLRRGNKYCEELSKVTDGNLLHRTKKKKMFLVLVYSNYNGMIIICSFLPLLHWWVQKRSIHLVLIMRRWLQIICGTTLFTWWFVIAPNNAMN